MRFTALDVETANPDYASICQIGVALFENGVVKNTFSSLVNPEDYFDPVNVFIHGITENDVAGAPTFNEILPAIKEFVGDEIVVHHMPFDKVAISRACTKYDLEPPEFAWLDSARIVRRAWEKFAYSGYGLSNVCTAFRIEYNAHDALEDSIAAGKVVIRAVQDTDISLNDWVTHSLMPISSSPKRVSFEGNTAGTLFGENLVFTGTLSMPRRQIAKIAADAGCNVTDIVNKSTTIFVLGNQDVRRLAGKKRSAKHNKAVALINKGIDIRIISENDLFTMLEITQ